MALILKKMCENAAKRYGMRLEAGQGGLHNIVQWVHTLESEKAAHFLHGGELVFTTGIGTEGGDWLLDFTKQLKHRDACGLVVNTGPYIKTIPDRVRQYCDQERFPLFTVPWDTRLVDMTRDFCNRIIEEEKKEESVGELLKDLILWPEKLEENIPALEKNGFSVKENCLPVCISIAEQAKRLPERYEEFILGRIERILCQANARYADFIMEDAHVFVIFGYVAGEAKELLREILSLQRGREDMMRLMVGAGAEGGTPAQLSENYKRARKLLTVCERKGKNALCYDDLEIEKILLDVQDQSVLAEYYRKYIGRLLAYDTENGTEYTRVLDIWLQHDGSVRQTADILYVHRNTVNYQLGRIRKILGLSFTLEDKMKLKLAFMIGEWL